ncbi:MAG: hypothetical protein U1E65_34785 [Myxococcota bacterium]
MSPAPAISFDELLEGQDRAAEPLDLSPERARDWTRRLSEIAKLKVEAPELQISAFSLVRGGDLFERSGRRKVLPRTAPELLDRFWERVELVKNRAAAPEVEAARAGTTAVLSGNPALARRLLLAKPLTITIIPKGRDYRQHGFPPHTNPNAAGIFWNGSGEARAQIGLREEWIAPKPYLAWHEMMHAVHLLAFTAKEREIVDRFLLPVALSRRGVEEVLAIYAERALGAAYGEDDLRAPGIYGKTRRDWNSGTVLARFMDELLCPLRAATR